MLERERRRVAGGEHVRNVRNAPVGVDGDEPAGALWQPWDRRADEARGSAITRSAATGGPSASSRTPGPTAIARAAARTAMPRSLSSSAIARLADSPNIPQRCGLWRDDRDLGFGPRVCCSSPSPGGHGWPARRSSSAQPDADGEHEREPRAVGERLRDGRRVGRAAERDRTVERRLRLRPDRDQQLVVVDRLARAVDDEPRVWLDPRVHPTAQFEGRVAADELERERVRHTEAEGRGDRGGTRVQLILRGEQGDARQRPRERAQRCHRFDRGDTAARDDDRLRWCSVHGSTVRPPRDAAIRSPPRRPAGHDGSGDDMSRLGS